MNSQWSFLFLALGAIVGVLGFLFKDPNMLALALVFLLACLWLNKVSKVAVIIATIGVVAAALMLSGCVEDRLYLRRQSPAVEAPKYFLPPPQADWVPIDFENPALLEQEVFVFEGSGTLEIVPNLQSGGWELNRKPLAYFRVGRAKSLSWYEYETIMLPRNSSFAVASSTVNFWGKGWPVFYYFSTGSNPGACEYTRVTPSNPRVYAGGYPVRLENQPLAPFGPGPLRLEYTIDTRPLGRAIKDALTGAIYGHQ